MQTEFVDKVKDYIEAKIKNIDIIEIIENEEGKIEFLLEIKNKMISISIFKKYSCDIMILLEDDESIIYSSNFQTSNEQIFDCQFFNNLSLINEIINYN